MMIEWVVYKDGRYYTSVYFEDDMDEESIKRSLVVHDGYSSNITIKKIKRGDV